MNLDKFRAQDQDSAVGTTKGGLIGHDIKNAKPLKLTHRCSLKAPGQPLGSTMVALTVSCCCKLIYARNFHIKGPVILNVKCRINPDLFQRDATNFAEALITLKRTYRPGSGDTARQQAGGGDNSKGSEQAIHDGTGTHGVCRSMKTSENKGKGISFLQLPGGSFPSPKTLHAKTTD
jgi:hypothetical protein